MLGFKHWDEIFVTKFILRSVCRNVVLVLGRAGGIHVARIPLVAECGDRIDSPVNEDSELCVFVTFGDFVILERLPVGAERTLVRCGIDLLQNRCALGVVLRTGFLPDSVNCGWILRCSWTSGCRALRNGARHKESQYSNARKKQSCQAL